MANVKNMDYSKTVNLLQTEFPMKADLPKREPSMLDHWVKTRIQEKIRSRAQRPMFLLHDGPPYANGVIHTGHALNKILKDFVVKFKFLSGFSTPYKPGWDCHGLPIEHQLFKQLGKSKHQVTRSEFRKQAADYAKGFVDKQREEFKRLGVFGEWGNPYLTLDNDYEAGILEVFYALQKKGYIERSKKPGYWCAYDETALAEAEVEYEDKSSDSVFVRFAVKTETVSPAVAKILPKKHENLYVLIWTTTPWTLPANVGLAFHPEERYTTVEKSGAVCIVAEKRQKAVLSVLGDGWTAGSATESGRAFVGVEAVNPIHGRATRAVTAGYVTMEDGTGIVHIAPGHGLEDFAVGLQWDLPVVSPVDASGKFDETVGHKDLIGKHVLKDANKAVMGLLGDNLLFHQTHRHSYPHCWRCKNPIIFRATEQWFLRVSDAFRRELLERIDNVSWEPSYGIHRIKGMVEQRPDWCLSRQRYWGTPIAVFYCKECRSPLQDEALQKRIVEWVRKEGSNVWYDKTEEEFLTGFRFQCAGCGGKTFVKEMDIFDVWFDSGVSWYSVVEKNWGDQPKQTMYLEGSDQHRGWFQTSLIPSVALRSKPPYDVVLTHGFVVDGKGHKMSKSLGNVIAPQEIIEKYGADVLRLWVAMSDYREDVRLSTDILKQIVDVYRRFRNTFRFLLQNTSDFRWADHHVPFERMEEIDRWILVHLEDVKRRALGAYADYQFHLVLSELNRFASVVLSGFYLDTMKDRLYCEPVASPLRRSAQTAFAAMLRTLSTLLAPLLSFTSEEAYRELRRVSLPDLPESVFLDEFSRLPSVTFDAALNDRWMSLLEIRSLVNDELDKKRKEGVLKSSQEALAVLHPTRLSEAQRAVFQHPGLDWPFLLQMAEVRIDDDSDSSAVELSPSAFQKCERCWRHRADVGAHLEHPTLCKRCADSLAPSARAS